MNSTYRKLILMAMATLNLGHPLLNKNEDVSDIKSAPLKRNLFSVPAIAQTIFEFGDRNMDMKMSEEELYQFYLQGVNFTPEKATIVSGKLLTLGDLNGDGRLTFAETIQGLNEVVNSWR